MSVAVVEWRKDLCVVTFPNGMTMEFPAYALRVVLPKATRVAYQQAAARNRKRVRVQIAKGRRAASTFSAFQREERRG